MSKIVPIFALFCSLAPFALGTTLQRMDLDDLTGQSNAVVYGKITGSRTAWDQAHTVIFTTYTVQAIQYLKGQLGPSFELRELGGERDGIAMKVPSVPAFSAGDEVVLFVWTDPAGNHQAIGFEQGALVVRTDPQSGAKTVDRAIRLGSASGGAVVTPAQITSRSLPQLFDQIRTSAEKAKAAAQ